MIYFCQEKILKCFLGGKKVFCQGSLDYCCGELEMQGKAKTPCLCCGSTGHHATEVWDRDDARLLENGYKKTVFGESGVEPSPNTVLLYLKDEGLINAINIATIVSVIPKASTPGSVCVVDVSLTDIGRRLINSYFSKLGSTNAAFESVGAPT